jgi:mono/diheme cytochrome c family protein
MTPVRALLLALLVLLPACDGALPADDATLAATLRALRIPPELAAGEAAFDANCAVCHGTRALGTDLGPPLVHIVYEPSHHSDLAFLIAVERGVRAHHWAYGDMPPVPGVSREEIQQIVAYVRYLQRQVGIE